METHPFLERLVRFGPFELDARRSELRKRGIRIGLQEQPLRILVALLAARGDLVTREALCRLLWPLGTFVDFEHSLNAAVRRLRVALGDDADVPRFVETVHRRGYRFLALDALRTAPARLPNRARLALMPFATEPGAADASGPTRDLFGEGLADETITQLALACGQLVAVIARTSVARLTETTASPGEIGRALEADYLVDGSIRRDGPRVRITARLIESQEETHLWAATYERVWSDLLTLQAEVAEAIATSVTRALLENKKAAVGF